MFDYEILEGLKKEIKNKYPYLYKKLASKEFQIDIVSIIKVRDDYYISVVDKKQNERAKLKFNFNKENSKITNVEIVDSDF